MLDQKLADVLAPTHSSERISVGVMGSVTASAVYTSSPSIAGATVAGADLSLFPSTDVKGLPPKVCGVLGEDFLQSFYVLIDYRHQVLELESGLGTSAATLTGEHLPVQLNGTLQGKPSFRRLIATSHIQELGDNTPLSLSSSTRCEQFHPLSETPNPWRIPAGVRRRALQHIGPHHYGDNEPFED